MKFWMNLIPWYSTNKLNMIYLAVQVIFDSSICRVFALKGNVFNKSPVILMSAVMQVKHFYSFKLINAFFIFILIYTSQIE